MNEDRMGIIYTRVGRLADEAAMMAQKELLEQYAKENNINVVNHFSDFAEGAVFSCPGLVEMQRACLNGEVNCVMISDAGRISRKMENFLMFLSEMDSMGVKIVIPGQEIDLFVKDEAL